MDEFAPAPAAAPRQQQQQQQQQPRGGSTGLGGQDWEELPQLPDDVDLEEQRMLMAAIQGGGYEGQLPGGCRVQGGTCAGQRAAWQAPGARAAAPLCPPCRSLYQ